MADHHYNFLKRNKINILQFSFGPFQENTYVIWTDNERSAYIIDPGMSNHQEEEAFLTAIQEHHLEPTAIYNTHCHIDHIMGVGFLQKKFQLPFFHHPLEITNTHRSEQMSALWNIPYSAPIWPGKDLLEGTSLNFGGEKMDVIWVPGHCEGHLAFIHHDSGTIISGDVLFKESIGRTDLPGGSMEILKNSIHLLYQYPEDFWVLSGHGPNTTIGHEKLHNPFFRAD